METPKKNIKQQLITYIILLILFVTRFPFADTIYFFSDLFGVDISDSRATDLSSLQTNFLYFFNGYSYILVALAIVMNRKNLERLNVDRDFLFILMCGGMIYNWEPNWSLGFFTGFILLLVFISGVFVWFRPEEKSINFLSPVVAIFIVWLLMAFGVINLSVNSTKIILLAEWYIRFIPFVVIEEMLFRGLLWMFLKNLNISTASVVVWQAIAFWLSHIYYVNNTIYFWIIIPIVSVFLGIIVRRTNSITLSAIVHLLFNLFVTYLLYILY